MTDIQEKKGGSLIQHGPASNRIYLMKLDSCDLPDLIPELDMLAAQKGYTKIFAKIPASFAAPFMQSGYQREGCIPRLYKAEADGLFLGKFIDPARAVTPDQKEIEEILVLAKSKSGSFLKSASDGFILRPACETDAENLAGVYRQVFASYPFPVHDPAYLIETMRSHVSYYIAEKDGKIAAAASGETDLENRNAEMTDFATLPEYTGNGLAVRLLAFMEPEMQNQGMKTLYTIARAVSPGMNITFAKCGYAFGGTLINNTQISGSIESMNLWFRHL